MSRRTMQPLKMTTGTPTAPFTVVGGGAADHEQTASDKEVPVVKAQKSLSVLVAAYERLEANAKEASAAAATAKKQLMEVFKAEGAKSAESASSQRVLRLVEGERAAPWTVPLLNDLVIAAMRVGCQEGPDFPSQTHEFHLAAQRVLKEQTSARPKIPYEALEWSKAAPAKREGKGTAPSAKKVAASTSTPPTE